MMTGISTTQPVGARTRLAISCAGFLMVAGPSFSVLADAAPRKALPSSEAIGWLLETEATGSAAPWANSRSGYSGTVTITQNWHRADGTPCREYTIAVKASGPQMTIKETTIRGTGCRVASGEWSLSEDAPVLVAVVPLSPPTQKPAGPDPLSPAPPAVATALPPPAVVETPAPAANDITFTTADFAPATAEHEPATISATLPSRSDD